MAARRTPRQILLDAMAEVRDFMPEVVRLVEQDYGGRTMHVHPTTVRNGKAITATSVPWPDLTIWFPGRPMPRFRIVTDGAFEAEGDPWADLEGLLLPSHLVELKAHGGKLKRGQPELFASIEAAGQPVHIWEPRDLDDKIPALLAAWSGRPQQPYDYKPPLRGRRAAV